MNSNYTELLTYFLDRFSGLNEQIFITVAKARLNGLNIKENLSDMSRDTEKLLRQDFDKLSEDGVTDWLLNLREIRKGNCYKEVAEKMTFGL